MVDHHRRYSSEEVAQIVRESLLSNRDEQARALTHADLEDIARQCGVDQATLHRTLERRQLAATKAAIRRRWRAKALTRLSWPLVACLVFVAMNVHNGGFPWAVFPILFWLMPTLSRARARLFPSDALLTRSARRFRSAYQAG